jgi:predicted dehydrogenase
MSSEAKKFGVGIRGAGQVAYEHANAIEKNPHLFLKGVCSRSLESARRLAAQYGSRAAVYETYEAMLSDEAVDIVSVCMPNHLHARDAVRAFEAKKHLILEKPPAINDEELQTLRQAADKVETRSVVSFVLRWHPMVSNLKAVLDQTRKDI